MSRRGLICILIGANLLLLAALVFTAFSPPAAFAQAPERRGDFMLLSAKAAPENDAVFLLDIANRQLHAFRTTYPRMAGQPIMVGHVNTRDLNRDFAAAGGR